MDHESLRHFADSWGLAALVTLFVAIVIYVMRPKGKKHYREAAEIPLKDDAERQAPRDEGHHRSVPDVDDVTGQPMTGHSWDGIRELNTPLPRWWLWTFYATIIWAIGYTIAYPAWPGLTGNTQGVLGWSSRGAVATEMTEAEAAKAGMVEKIANTDLAGILADDEMRTFAHFA